MTNFVKAAGQTQRGLSPLLWGSLPERLISHPGSGIWLFDDFADLKQLASGTTGQYASYQDTGVTIKGSPIVSVANGQFGVLEVAGNDATNDEGHIIVGGNAGAAFKIADAGAEARVVCFECRVKKAVIADTATTGFFVGLGEEGLAAADSLVDTTLEVASKDLVGFHVLASDGDAVQTIFRKAGQAKQVVSATAGALVADTWIKLGFRYDPKAPAANKIRFFVNGAELTDYVTATQIAAATFPDDEELTPVFLTKNAITNTESKLQMDWWAAGMQCYQE